MSVTLILGLVVIGAAVYAIMRRIDVRLALLTAALVMGSLGGDPIVIVRTFLVTFSNLQYVVPICSAMGFAYVLRHTGCDQHLIHLLIRPLQRVRVLLIPGAVIVGFLVNIPVISQTSTAVAVGTVLVPLMLAARVPPVTAGAALLLGASVGGELLNPGAPELRTISRELHLMDATLCVQRIFPLLLVQLTTATALFWVWCVVADRRRRGGGPPAGPAEQAEAPPFRVNLVKASVPLVPLALLFATALPQRLFEVPRSWLVDEKEKQAFHPDVANQREGEAYSIRLIGMAMLVGVAAAALTSPRAVPGVARAFFEGAGYAFANIVSLIVAASCFGKGVEQIGLADLLGRLIKDFPALLFPSAGTMPLAFAWVSGSGMASTESLFKFFASPAGKLGIDGVHVGAVVSIAAAAGRTMSPVAAVTLMAASMSETDPLTLARRVAFPLLAATVVMVLVAVLIRPG